MIDFGKMIFCYAIQKLHTYVHVYDLYNDGNNSFIVTFEPFQISSNKSHKQTIIEIAY